MKAQIELHARTNNREIPCDHDVDNEGCRARYKAQDDEGFDPSRCKELMRAQLRLRFSLIGPTVYVQVGDDDTSHHYALSADDMVELDGLLSVLRHQQMTQRYA